MQAFFRGLAASCVALGISFGPAAFSPAAAQVFNPESFTLKNGMQVVVIPNHRVPVISHMVYYKVGASNEVEGKTGLAHMVEHMMFKGTKTVPAGAFSQIVAANGGRDNAFTTADYTAYYQNVAADKLELVMKLEADRMANLSLKDSDFEPEKQVVLEERRMRIENEPEALLDEQMQASLYLNSPYHHPVIGWRPDMERYRLQDVVDFHARWYAPNNAILVVAGDITAARLKPLAEKYYGVIPSRPVPPRPLMEEPAPLAARSVEMRDPDVHQPTWQRLYLAPSYHAGEVKQAYPLQLLAEILGGGATSRFYKALVVDQKLAASVSVGYDPDAVGPGNFAFAASPRPGVEMDALQKAMIAEIAEVAAKGVTSDELTLAKQRLQSAVTYARDSYTTGARVLGQALSTGQSIAEEEAWPQHIQAVSAEEISEAAKAVLRDERSVTGVLLPADGANATTEAITAGGAPRAPAGLSGKEIR